MSPEVGRLPEFSGLLFAVAGAVWARRCWRNAEALASGSRPLRPGRTTAGRLIPVLDIRMRRRILLGRWWASGVTGSLLPDHWAALSVPAVRRTAARRPAVLDVPPAHPGEAAVEAGRAKLSAE
ncbi:hypothetical protein [Kitasatospora griseola]|uniref:hypothetical protein n=1 Tax=Kitasatospora griseola TaxID=2064 RepID=UPI003657B0AA